MKNACKVVTTYFGPRRKWPLDYNETLDMFNVMIEMEKNIDKGTDCDTIIVNHLLEENNYRVIELLDSLNGTKTKNGTIITMNRPWDNGEGYGFKSRDYVWKKYQDEYDYWFFTEDDENWFKEGYVGMCIDVLERDETCAFVGTQHGIAKDCIREGPPQKYIWPHCHSGQGCTHRRFLKELVQFYGNIPYPNSKEYNDAEEIGEVESTSIFLKMGYKLRRLEDDVQDTQYYKEQYRDYGFCKWRIEEKKRLENFYYNTVYHDKESKNFIWYCDDLWSVTTPPYRSPKAISESIKDIITDKVVCELGCAEGDNMVFMSKYAKKVVGLEYSDRINPAIERGLDVKRGDYYELDFDDFPKADVYYFWPNNGDEDNKYLCDKIYSNENFKGYIIVAGDTGWPPEPPSVRECAKLWDGTIKEVEFNEGTGHRQSGTFVLAIIEKK